MKALYLPLLILSISFLGGCVSKTEESKNSKSTQVANQNVLPPGFGDSVQNQSESASKAATDNSNSNQSESKSFIELRDEEKRRKALEAQNSPPPPIDLSKIPKTILSDGSEYTAILDSKGVTETRIFKGNPELEKIEKLTQGKQVKILAYLKNGRVIQVPNNKISDFAQTPADQILKAIGLNKSVDIPKESQTKQAETKQKPTGVN